MREKAILIIALASCVRAGKSNAATPVSDPHLDAIGTQLIRAVNAEPTQCPVHLRAFGAFSIGICGRLPSELREEPTTVKRAIDSVLPPTQAADSAGATAWTKEGYLSYRASYVGRVPILVEFFTGSMRDVPKGLVVFQYPQQFDNCKTLDGAGTVDESKPWTPPSQREAPPPKYPDFARRARQEGTVVLEIVVSGDGSVSDVCVQGSTPFFDFETAAAEAVRKWRFEPATQRGVPVSARIQVAVLFGGGG